MMSEASASRAWTFTCGYDLESRLDGDSAGDTTPSRFHTHNTEKKCYIHAGETRLTHRGADITAPWVSPRASKSQTARVDREGVGEGVKSGTEGHHCVINYTIVVVVVVVVVVIIIVINLVLLLLLLIILLTTLFYNYCNF